MYKIQNNPTAKNSQNRISKALEELMKKKSFQEISITELCKKAEVGRKTFYRNFDTKEDIIDYQLDMLYQEYEAKYKTIDSSKYLYLYLSFIKEHMDYIVPLNRDGLLAIAANKFSEFTYDKDLYKDREKIYYRYFETAGINAVIALWADHHFEESIEEMVRIIKDIHTKKDEV